MSETPEVQTCKKCPRLVKNRTQIVNGVGDLNSSIMFVGEAPGANEDKEGEPFVGRSGDVLNESLEKRGIKRKNVRITNTVKCRPPENKDPHKDERESCFPYLVDEIQHVEPEVIVTLGSVPSRQLLNDQDISVSEMAGEEIKTEFGGYETKVIVGIHPAATLYDGSYKEKFNKVLDIVEGYA